MTPSLERQAAIAAVGIGLVVTGLEAALIEDHAHGGGSSSVAHLLALAGMVVLTVVVVWRGVSASAVKDPKQKQRSDRDAVR